jgi:hypothetical protein
MKILNPEDYRRCNGVDSKTGKYALVGRSEDGLPGNAAVIAGIEAS